MILRSLVAAALAAALVVAPDPASAQEAAAPAAEDDGPPQRFPATSARWKLVAGGLGLTAGAYGIGAITSAAWPEVPGAEHLYIPVAGPWIMLGQSGCAADDPGCEAIVVVRAVLLVLDGLIQAGGVAVAGEGIFMTTESETAAAPAPRREAAVTVMPAPIVTDRQAGLGVVGAF